MKCKLIIAVVIFLNALICWGVSRRQVTQAVDLRPLELEILALNRRLDNLPAAVDYTERLTALESRPKAVDQGARIKALEERLTLTEGIDDKLIATGRKSNEQIEGMFKGLLDQEIRMQAMEKKVGTACKALNDYVNQSKFGHVDTPDFLPNNRLSNRRQGYKSKQQDMKDLQQ